MMFGIKTALTVIVIAVAVCAIATPVTIPKLRGTLSKAEEKIEGVDYAVRSTILTLWQPYNNNLCYMERSPRYENCETPLCVTVGYCQDQGGYCSLVKKLFADRSKFYEWCTGCTCTHTTGFRRKRGRKRK